MTEQGGQPTSPIVVENLDNLLFSLRPLQAAAQQSLWFRGHRDSTWDLTPSAFRSQQLARNEQAMLARFRQEASAASQSLGIGLDEWGWITFAQHHSLPTRLLDWSTSPLVGLFFACQPDPDLKPGQPDTDGEFFCLDPLVLNTKAGQANGGSPLLLSTQDDVLQNYLPTPSGNRLFPRAVIAPMTFDRIRFQSGTFTVQQAPSAGDPTEPLRNNEALNSFIIPSSAKEAIRDDLAILGFDDASIFRDLDRIANRIKSENGGL